MQIIINIPDEIYNYIHNEHTALRVCDGHKVAQAIANGTPLPKGHGRLIDADIYRKEMLDSREFDFFKRLDMQPTIIEADKESEG